ncbi:MAG: branched-chain amino acid transaminase [Deltaproteobacteria bacterium]|nr:branched-chain amino acid transaminase [Deltaproteobacteria bacterium]
MSARAPVSKVGKYAWYNGEIVETSSIQLSVSTNVAHYGSGVFEGIRFYETPKGPAVFRLMDHMKRLVRGSRFYSLDLKWSAEQLAAATIAVIVKEGTNAGYIRPLVYFGEGPIHLRAKAGCPTDAFIVTRSITVYLGEENVERGVRVTVTKWRKAHFTAVPTSAKGCGQYANSVLAVHEAMERGYDEALLLNQDGTVAEGSGENVFWVRDGKIYTNDATSSILPGITRDTILTLARDSGIPSEVRPFTLPELLDADEMFLTGTAAEVTLVRELDGRMYPTGPSTIGYALQKKYQDVVHGRAPGYERWLTPVR